MVSKLLIQGAGMMNTRVMLESRVESLERSLLELRKGYQTRLDEIMRLWKMRKGDYFRRRSRRDHAPSRRRRTPTMYAEEEKNAEEEDDGRGSEGSNSIIFYTLTEPETHSEGELKANREIPKEGKFQVAHKVETEVEADGGDVSDLSEMKTEKEENRHVGGGRGGSDDGRCIGGSDLGTSSDGHCEGGGRGRGKVTMGGSERVRPPERGASMVGGGSSTVTELGGPQLPAKRPPPEPPDLGVYMETGGSPVSTVGGSSPGVDERLQSAPPELLKLPDQNAPMVELGPSHAMVALPLPPMEEKIKQMKEEARLGLQRNGQGFNLIGQAQHDKWETRILEFVSHLRIGEDDSENAWLEFGPNITGTWPIKFGFIAEALVKHKAIRGTKIEVLSIRGPADIFSANISVGTCTNSIMHGDLCNSTTHPPFCTPSDIHNAWEATVNKPMLENIEACNSNFEMTGVHEDIFRGAAGWNTHIRLYSDRSDKIFVEYCGLSSLDSMDYVYANKTRRSGPFMFFMPYDSSDGKVFYLMYASREGTWSSGLRYFNTSSDSSKAPTIMSLSLERSSKRCSSHGDCKLSFDTSGLTSYSFGSCDQNHGDCDCRIEIATHQGKVWQAIFLIVWNAGAILFAYWSLQQKALAEWAKFTFSGTYNTSDADTWCALNYNVIQSIDFWLPFMAAISTFLYLATIEEKIKRAVHTAIPILVRGNKSEDLEVLVMWKNLPSCENSWEKVTGMQELFPDFHLEDKVNFEGAGIDADIRPNGNKVYEKGKWKPINWGKALNHTKEREHCN